MNVAKQTELFRKEKSRQRRGMGFSHGKERSIEATTWMGLGTMRRESSQTRKATRRVILWTWRVRGVSGAGGFRRRECLPGAGGAPFGDDEHLLKAMVVWVA